MKQTMTGGSRARKELQITVSGSSPCLSPIPPFQDIPARAHSLSMSSSGRKGREQCYYKTYTEKTQSLAKGHLESVQKDTTASLCPH